MLTRDQLRVLQAVYDRFRASETWPKFGEVDRQLDRAPRRVDVGTVVQTVPKTLLQPLGGPPSAVLDYPMRLTIEGVSRCTGSQDDVSLFLQALRWMARQERKFTPTTPDVVTATVDDQSFIRSQRIPKRRYGDIRRLGELLMVEHWGWMGAGRNPADGKWHFTLGRDVRRFASAYTLDEYLAIQRAWREEALRPFVTGAVPIGEKQDHASPPDVSTSTAPDYVDHRTVELLETGSKTSSWKCDKLLQLIAELNDNYARRNAHAAHALLRAIADHVPPLFGYRDFAQVVNNYQWSATDKSYMKRLLDAKKQADEALHHQISEKDRSHVSIDDLPNRRPINRLLEECATLI